jgi:transcriptional regulator with XRE-family HTH domain
MGRTNTGQLELAAKSGLSGPMISQVLSGRAKPSSAAAARISAASGGKYTVVELLFPGGLPEGAVLCRKCELCSRPVRTDA